jgi:hypothetical protein
MGSLKGDNGSSGFTLPGNYGVWGDSANNFGVVGSSGNSFGVFGVSTLAGMGVKGNSNSGTGVNGFSVSGRGVAGFSDKSDGVFGQSDLAGTQVINNKSNAGVGVYGVNNQSLGIGISGEANNAGTGVLGHSDTGTGVMGTSAGNNGIHGITSSDSNSAIYGENTSAGIGVFGRGGPNGGEGVFGQTASSSSGIYGKNTSGGNGVTGESVNGIGVYGKGAQNAGFFEGNVTVTGDVILTGADCAEDFDIAQAANANPGTVMVLNPGGTLQECQQAYDKRVAGVVSGAGNYKPGMILDRQQSPGNRLPVALVGKVYCKVDAQFAPIEVGDLLTTSPTPGHAMKAEDPSRAFGSVIGKAMRPLEAGQGIIPILIALQ